MNKSIATSVLALARDRRGRDITRAKNSVAKLSTLILEVIDAASSPKTTETFYARKHACYARFGATAASVPPPGQVIREHLRLVIATDPDSMEIVGGIGVYIRNRDVHLPVELAIGHMPAMQQEIARWENRKIAELSCLWTEEAWRKTGLSEHLAQLGLAAAHLLDVEKVIAFGHQHLIKVYETWGFLPEPGLDNFSYPDPSYVSSVSSADAVGFMTVPPRKRVRLVGYADALADHRPISWRQEETCAPRRGHAHSDSGDDRNPGIDGYEK